MFRGRMRERDMPEDKPAVQAAKVSAKGAIIVALITTLGGVVAGYLVRQPANSQQPADLHWLTIEGIEAQGYLDVRLLMTVNGVKFSYPSSSVWQEVGPRMSTANERFLLPPAEESYRVSFQAFQALLSDNVAGEATSSGEQKGQTLKIEYKI